MIVNIVPYDTCDDHDINSTTCHCGPDVIFEDEGDMTIVHATKNGDTGYYKDEESPLTICIEED